MVSVRILKVLRPMTPAEREPAPLKPPRRASSGSSVSRDARSSFFSPRARRLRCCSFSDAPALAEVSESKGLSLDEPVPTLELSSFKTPGATHPRQADSMRNRREGGEEGRGGSAPEADVDQAAATGTPGASRWATFAGLAPCARRCACHRAAVTTSEYTLR